MTDTPATNPAAAATPDPAAAVASAPGAVAPAADEHATGVLEAVRSGSAEEAGHHLRRLVNLFVTLEHAADKDAALAAVEAAIQRVVA
jgi:hypothetical protein